jgi:hypothetical protein
MHRLLTTFLILKANHIERPLVTIPSYHPNSSRQSGAIESKIKVTENLFDGFVSFKQLGIYGFLQQDAVCIN